MVLPLQMKALINVKESRTNKSNINNVNIPNNKLDLSGYYQNVRCINNKLKNLICIKSCDYYYMIF